jgi:hypothetical protein
MGARIIFETFGFFHVFSRTPLADRDEEGLEDWKIIEFRTPLVV